jgi:hypothetical protein
MPRPSPPAPPKTDFHPGPATVNRAKNPSQPLKNSSRCMSAETAARARFVGSGRLDWTTDPPETCRAPETTRARMRFCAELRQGQPACRQDEQFIQPQRLPSATPPPAPPPLSPASEGGQDLTSDPSAFVSPHLGVFWPTAGPSWHNILFRTSGLSFHPSSLRISSGARFSRPYRHPNHEPTTLLQATLRPRLRAVPGGCARAFWRRSR